VTAVNPTPAPSLVFQSACLLVASRLVVMLFPLAMAQRCLLRLARLAPVRGQATGITEAIAAVREGATLVPGSWCLQSALAAQALLRNIGMQPELRIGLAHSPIQGMRAHAWLELDGLPVLGGSKEELSAYVPLFPRGCEIPSSYHWHLVEPNHERTKS
jgi:hypothetical protein